MFETKKPIATCDEGHDLCFDAKCASCAILRVLRYAEGEYWPVAGERAVGEPSTGHWPS
jgi:hypothetical protein